MVVVAVGAVGAVGVVGVVFSVFSWPNRTDASLIEKLQTYHDLPRPDLP